jgi:hypothetical protein
VRSLFSGSKKSVMGFDEKLLKPKSTHKLLNNILELSPLKVSRHCVGKDLNLTSSYFKFKPRAKANLWYLAPADYFYAS